MLTMTAKVSFGHLSFCCGNILSWLLEFHNKNLQNSAALVVNFMACMTGEIHCTANYVSFLQSLLSL